MNNPLISVIVPIYQVQDYLKECIDSILKQSLTDYELILVDDGSTDNCPNICDEYAEKDNRIIVIHQKNAGLSAARNAGLDIARGQYYAMVDSDDVLISKDYLKYLYEFLIQENCLMSVCMLGKVDDEELTQKPQEYKLLDKHNYWYTSVYPGFYLGCAYGKLYHKSLFDNVRYPIGRTVEDQAVIHHLVYQCDKIVAINAKMYGYRYRESSIMISTNPYKLMEDIIYAFEDRRHFFIEQNEPDLAKLAENTMLCHLNPIIKRLDDNK